MRLQGHVSSDFQLVLFRAQVLDDPRGRGTSTINCKSKSEWRLSPATWLAVSGGLDGPKAAKQLPETKE